MEHGYPITLPPDYQESALFLLVQSPRVLYAYWELSPGLKEALRSAKKKMQIRLNIKERGPYYTRDIDLSTRSYYFSEVEPGLTYNCEIGIIHTENDFYPLLRSNSLTAPHDRPPGGRELTDEHTNSVFDMSSWALYGKK